MSIPSATASLRPSLMSSEQDHHSTPPITVPSSPWYVRFTFLIGGAVLLLGLVVMLGWHTQNLALVRMLATAAPMYYNSALCFILSGIGLLAVACQRAWLTGLTGGILGALAGLTLSQYFFDVDLGIDQALMTDWVGFGSLPLGRMAPATAVGFVLSGGGLMSISNAMRQQSTRGSTLAGTAGAVVVTLGLVTLGLYMTDVMAAEGWGSISKAMATHTAGGLTLVGAGLLSWVWQEEQQRQSSLASELPLIAGLSVVTITLLLWQALLVQQQSIPAVARTVLPTILLGAGLLIAMFVMVTVFLAQKARRQVREAAVANYALQQEIATRRQMAAALRESEERFRLFMNYSPAIAWMKDEQGRYMYFNQTYERRFGIRLAEWWGKTDHDVWPIEIAAVFRKNDLAVIEAKGPLEVLENTSNPDGTRRTWWNFKFPFQDAAGKKYIAGMGIDITDRVQAETALRTLNAELDQRVQERTAALQQATADLRQIAYISAHDLQEPVRQIGLYTQLLAARYRNTLETEVSDAIAFIVEGTQRMQAQFTDLMQYLEVDAQDHHVALVECEILFHQALAHVHAQLTASGATVTHDPLPTVVANAEQLQLVFQELLDNALKFRDSKPARVHIWAEREADGWRFAVRDQGIGIESRYAGQLFRFFRRLQSRSDFPGTGMGLAICKKIVERHGGRIWLDSQSGAGTTIYFTVGDSHEQRGREEAGSKEDDRRGWRS